MARWLVLLLLLLFAAPVYGQQTNTFAADVRMCSGRPWVDVTCNGADPTGVGDSTTAINTTLSAAITNGWPVFFPAGTYKVTSKISVDFQSQAANGLEIISRGATMDGRTIPSGNVLQFLCSGGTVAAPIVCGSLRLSGQLTVAGSTSGYVVALGKTDFSDRLNGTRVERLIATNTGSGGAIQANYVTDADLWFSGSTSGGSSSVGAVALEQVQSSKIGGRAVALGASAPGLLLENGASANNQFLDFAYDPNDAVCISITSTAAVLNAWLAPLLPCATAVNAPAPAGKNTLIGPSFAGTNTGPTSPGVAIVGRGSLSRYSAPTAASVSLLGTDDGTIFSAANGTGTLIGFSAASLPVTLPDPAKVGSGYTVGFVSDANKAVVLSTSAGAILLAGQQFSQLIVGGPPNALNFETAVIVSDGANFRVEHLSQGAALLNGAQTSLPAHWEFPSGPGYQATQGDNGMIISSAQVASGLSVTLPPTTAIQQGYMVGIAVGNNHPITLNLNGTSGGALYMIDGSTPTSPVFYLNNVLQVFQFNGSAFLQVVGNVIPTYYQVATNVALKALNNPHSPFVVRQGFYSPEDGGRATYSYSSSACSLNAGAGDDGSQVKAVDGGCWVASFSDTPQDVRIWGADPTGILDSAPAFRAAFVALSATHRYITARSGTFTFCSTVASGYSVVGPPAVRILNQSNFVLDLRGSTFQICNSATNGSQGAAAMIQIDATTPGAAGQFQVLGGTFVGNHTGVTANQESCGIVPIAVHDFTFQGQRFTGNWGGQSTGFCGDWQVNGAYRDISVYGGQCFDFAFIAHTHFDNIHGYGIDFNGGNSANQVGMKCFSFIYDTQMNTANNTGDTSFSDNVGVTVSNSSATNFIQGYYINSGRDYTFTGNQWYGNVGCPNGGSTCDTWNASVNFYGQVMNAYAGYGGVIAYDGGGSVNHPVVGFISQGESYTNNGNTVQHGGALLISTTVLTNGTDVMTDYVMTNSRAFQNNQYVVEASANSAGKLLNVNFSPLCTDDRTIQIYCIGPNLIRIKNPYVPSTQEVMAFNNLVGVNFAFASTVQGNGDAFRSSGLASNTGGTGISVAAGTCGTSPAVFGTNTAGVITVGTGSNGDTCTLNFSAPWVNEPACIGATTQSLRQVYTASVTPTQVSFSGIPSLSAGDFILYLCSGWQ